MTLVIWFWRSQQLRVGLAELVDDDAGEVGHELGLDAEEVAVADGLAEDAAQDVAAALVAGEDAVADEEDGAADVVGDDAEGLVLDRVGAVGDAGELGGAGDDGLVEVGLVHGAGALHEQDEALQAHAGIDARLRQRGAGAVGGGVVLHEDVVPQLEVARAVAAGGAVVLAAAPFLAAVDVDLAVGAVRAGGAGGPPVVLQLEDAVFGDADLVAPDGVGLLVVRVDGWVEAVLREADPFGEELPGPGEGFLLEVVTHGEVAEHEEEGAVGLVADLVDIDGAEALLDGAHAHGRRRFQAEEVWGHLLHAGGGEEDGVVAGGRDEGGAGHVEVLLGLEEVDEHLADVDAGLPLEPEIGGLLGGHGGVSGWWRGRWSGWARWRRRLSRPRASSRASLGLAPEGCGGVGGIGVAVGGHGSSDGCGGMTRGPAWCRDACPLCQRGRMRGNPGRDAWGGKAIRIMVNHVFAEGRLP